MLQTRYAHISSGVFDRSKNPIQLHHVSTYFLNKKIFYEIYFAVKDRKGLICTGVLRFNFPADFPLLVTILVKQTNQALKPVAYNKPKLHKSNQNKSKQESPPA